MTEPSEGVEVLGEPDRIALLMDPARQRLVRALAHRPDSATGLARRLGDSRQRLYYHLRLMEEAKLIEVEEERQRRGAVERVYRLVARRFVLDPAALGELAAEPMDGDRFSATYLVALASRAIRELAALMGRARSTGKRLPTVGINAEVRLEDPEEFNAFSSDLGRAVAEVVGRYDAKTEGTGRSFRIVAGAYPRPSGTGTVTDTEEDST